MGEQAPKTHKLTSTLIRYHSPYCEARGPLVRQGFVSDRVRAIQGSYQQAQAQQRASNLSIISGFTDRRPRRVKLHAPPESLLAPGKPATKQTQVTAKQPPPLPPRSGNTQSDPVTSTGSDYTVNGEAGDFITATADEDGEVLLSPRAIPPRLAVPSESPTRSHSGERQSGNSPGLMPMLYSRQSVAERLGDMVGNGPVESDVSCQAYNGRHSTVASTSSHPSRTSPGRILLRQRCRNQEEDGHGNGSQQTSTDQTRAVSVHGDPSYVRHDSQSQRMQGSTSSDYKTVQADSRGSEGNESTREGRIALNRGDFNRTGLSTTSTSSNDCSDHHLKSGKIYSNPEVDRHLSEWKYTSSEDNELKYNQVASAKSSGNNTFEGPLDPVILSQMSFAKSSHASRTPKIHHSKRSATRSMSWFAKLAGYKLVLVDKTPTVPGLTWPNLERQQQYQHHQPHRTSQRQQPLSTSARGGDSWPESLPKSEGSPKDINNQRRESVQSAQPQYPDARSTPLFPPSESQRDHHPSCRKTSNVPEDKMRSSDGGYASSAMPKKSQSERILGERTRESSLPKGFSKAASGSYGSQTPPGRRSRGNEHARGSSQTSDWQSTGNETRIRQVHVIVSLDGADDVLLQAGFLERLTELGSSVAVHRVQSPELWVDTCSGPKSVPETEG